MHISNAKVDLNGNLVADGTIKFPPSKNDVFLEPDVRNLAISFENGFLHGAKANRDETSGYLCTKLVGPRIILPIEISQFLKKSLGYSRSVPVMARVNDHNGKMRIGDPAAKCLDPSLSDWLIEIEPKEGNLHIKISASLYDNTPQDAKWLYQYAPPQYWSDQVRGNKKLQLEFKVDLITRALLFGAIEPEIPSSNLAVLERPPSNSKTIKLKNTMMNSFGDFICVGEENSFFAVSQARNSNNSEVVIRQLSKAEYYETGLFDYCREVSPRVSLNCISLQQICHTLTYTNSYSMILDNGDFGKLAPPGADRWDYDNEVKPDRRIRKAHLNFKLNEQGLKIECDLHCPSHAPTATRPGWHQCGRLEEPLFFLLEDQRFSDVRGF